MRAMREKRSLVACAYLSRTGHVSEADAYEETLGLLGVKYCQLLYFVGIYRTDVNSGCQVVEG